MSVGARWGVALTLGLIASGFSAAAAQASDSALPDDGQSWCRMVLGQTLEVFDTYPGVTLEVGVPQGWTDTDGSIVGNGPGVQCTWMLDDFTILTYSLAEVVAADLDSYIELLDLMAEGGDVARHAGRYGLIYETRDYSGTMTSLQDPYLIRVTWPAVYSEQYVDGSTEVYLPGDDVEALEMRDDERYLALVESIAAYAQSDPGPGEASSPYVAPDEVVPWCERHTPELYLAPPESLNLTIRAATDTWPGDSISAELRQHVGNDTARMFCLLSFNPSAFDSTSAVNLGVDFWFAEATDSQWASFRESVTSDGRYAAEWNEIPSDVGLALLGTSETIGDGSVADHVGTWILYTRIDGYIISVHIQGFRDNIADSSATGEFYTSSFDVDLLRQIAASIAAELLSGQSVTVDTGIAAPTILSTLPTIQSLNVTPTAAVTTAGAAAVFVVAVAWPGRLLDVAIGERWPRVINRFAPIARRSRGLRDSLRRLPSWLPIAIGIAAATLISGFLDPHFGEGPNSIRLTLTILMTFLLESFVGLLLIARLARRRWTGVAPRLQFELSSLILAGAAVLLSRVAGFEPGFLFGILLGLVFVPQIDTQRDGTVKRWGIAWVAVLGMLSWILYSLITPLLGVDLAGTFITELLGGLVVACFGALPITLLPLRGFPGHALFTQSRIGWGASYLLGSGLVLLALLPLPASWTDISAPLTIWILLYIAYAAAAISIWWALNRWMPVEDPNATPAAKETADVTDA